MVASNLLIFSRVNWPQCVKSTAIFLGLDHKLGGRLNLVGLATIWGACGTATAYYCCRNVLHVFIFMRRNDDDGECVCVCVCVCVRACVRACVCVIDPEAGWQEEAQRGKPPDHAAQRQEQVTTTRPTADNTPDPSRLVDPLDPFDPWPVATKPLYILHRM